MSQFDCGNIVVASIFSKQTPIVQVVKQVNRNCTNWKPLHLSQLDTPWTAILEDKNDRVSDAQRHVLEYYGDCILRYLRKLAGDENVANDLGQEFAIRFIQGNYHNANPERGRFRDYLKALLRNLYNEYCRKQNKKKSISLTEVDEVAAVELQSDFDEIWRQTVLARTWEKLRVDELDHANSYYTVLKFRADHPTLRSSKIAEQLSVQIGKELTSDWVRQKLSRSRKRFAELLLVEVGDTVQSQEKSDIEAELAELRLLAYVD